MLGDIRSQVSIFLIVAILLIFTLLLNDVRDSICFYWLLELRADCVYYYVGVVIWGRLCLASTVRDAVLTRTFSWPCSLRLKLGITCGRLLLKFQAETVGWGKGFTSLNQSNHLDINSFGLLIQSSITFADYIGCDKATYPNTAKWLYTLFSLVSCASPSCYDIKRWLVKM